MKVNCKATDRIRWKCGANSEGNIYSDNSCPANEFPFAEREGFMMVEVGNIGIRRPRIVLVEDDGQAAITFAGQFKSGGHGLPMWCAQ